MSEEPQTAWPVVETRGVQEPDALADILALAAAARESDGNPPLSEQTLVDLRSADADPDTLAVFTTYADDGAAGSGNGRWLAGAAVLVAGSPQDPGVLELVVHPNYRNQGVGTALAAAVAGQASGRARPSAIPVRRRPQARCLVARQP